MPFTEKPTEMVEFGSKEGIPYIDLKWKDKQQEWRWNFESGEFDLVIENGKVLT